MFGATCDGVTDDTPAFQELTDVAYGIVDDPDLPREIPMSPRDFKAFLSAVESDDIEPNDALKRAAEKFKEKYGRR